MPTKTVVLTDVARGIWLDSFAWNEEPDLQLKGSPNWSIGKRTLRGGLADGVDVIDINNGALIVSLLPTRGMGLWRGSYQGIPIGWQSPVALPVNPAFVDFAERGGLGWLRGFNEWLCRCGLASNGAPGTDVVWDDQGNRTETDLTLHGRIANTPAHYVSVQVSTEGAGRLSVTGEVDEATMFGSCLRLKSTLETEAGSNRLRILDEVTNRGGQPAELELLYHTNLGKPFLDAGASFRAAIQRLAPRDDHAATEIDNYHQYEEPTAGYQERVYFMELAADAHDESLVLLRNSSGDRGISLRFNRQELPCFSLWKCTQAEADGYVTGLEPATNFPNLKTFEREQKRVIGLGPGESYQTHLEMSIHASVEEVQAVEQEIASLQGELTPQVDRQPNPAFSPRIT